MTVRWEAEPRARVLVVDALPEVRARFHAAAARVAGPIDVVGTPDAAEGLALAGRGGFDLVVADHAFATSVSGLEILEKARSASPLARRVLMSPYAVRPDLVALLRSTFIDEFLPKPFHERDAVALLERLLPSDEVAQPPAEPFAPGRPQAGRLFGFTRG
jgi:DNA-binding NtrC family response regulator